MATYAIGDVQGCYDELVRLIDRLNFDPADDELWFVGDLVNRGPKSLEVLRFARSLKDNAIVVLGNHDLHLLAAGYTDQRADEDFKPILQAEDADQLLDWLRRRPLAHYGPEQNTLMVHAGLEQSWDPLGAIKLAREVEDEIRGPNYKSFFSQMYGDEPSRWSSELRGMDRLRFILNCLTRIRYCFADGALEFNHNGPPGEKSDGLTPWFDLPSRASDSVRIVCGHWSALGLMQRPNLLMIDTGCVWGRELTAVRLDGPLRFTSVAAL